MKWFLIRKFGDKEYKVCLPYLYFIIVSLLVISFIGFSQNDWSLEPKFYYKCNSVSGCENEYFNSLSCTDSAYSGTDICKKSFLLFNESIGEKPSFIVSNLNTITLSIILGFLIGNTWIFNKDLFKDFNLE